MESNIKKCLIIYNPNSGKAISKDILAIYRNILKERGYDIRPITQDVKPKNFW